MRVPQFLPSRRTEERGFHFWRRCGLQMKQGDPQFKLCLVPFCSVQWLIGQASAGLLPHATFHCLLWLTVSLLINFLRLW